MRRILLASLLLGLTFAAACTEAPDTGSVAATEELSASVVEPMSPPVAESTVVVMESAPTSDVPGRSAAAAPSPRRGVITAGDIDDLLNFAQFQRYQGRAARDLSLPKLALARSVRAQLTGPDGRPAPGVPVSLRKPGSAQPFYQGLSGVDGWVTVFPALLGAGLAERVELRAFGAGQESHDIALRTDRAEKVSLPFAGGYKPDFLDLVFVFDTTGSMGDELAWLTKEFGGIVQAARRAAPGASIRFGLVAYRDHGDDYVVRNFGFTQQQAQMQGWLRSLDANGGGDYPEAAAAALQAAVDLNWRRGNGERLLFHVADAPPHSKDARAYLAAAQKAAAKQVQIFGLGASGVAEESEFLMRQASAATAGRYLFLTDDSGVGFSHAEPSIACYRVTRLTSLLRRVLASELSGIRVEAQSGEVLRDVGTYRRGVCME